MTQPVKLFTNNYNTNIIELMLKIRTAFILNHGGMALS